MGQFLRPSHFLNLIPPKQFLVPGRENSDTSSLRAHSQKGPLVAYSGLQSLGHLAQFEHGLPSEGKLASRCRVCFNVRAQHASSVFLLASFQQRGPVPSPKRHTHTHTDTHVMLYVPNRAGRGGGGGGGKGQSSGSEVRGVDGRLSPGQGVAWINAVPFDTLCNWFT